MNTVFVLTFSDVVGVVLFASLIASWLVALALHAFKTLLCDHKSYREDRSCSAICSKCGKNLGFIGTVRKERGQP
jgi:hypothetical protein